MSAFEEESKTDEVKFPSCLDYFWSWRSCVSATSQFHQYYIHGKFEDCLPRRTDLMMCLKNKGKSADAKEWLTKRLAEENQKRNPTIPSSSIVWEFRENRTKDWNS